MISKQKKTKTFFVNKKGQGIALGLLATFAVVFLIIVMTTTISAKILENFGNAGIFTAGTVSKNLTTAGQQGFQQFADFYPITGLVLIGAVIIGLLVSFR